MKCVGASAPCSGWFHRSSASAPEIVPASQVHHRLVDQVELAVLERVPQVPLRAHPRERRDVHALLEEDVLAAPVFLRAVHRGVGVAQQILRQSCRRPDTRRCRCSRSGSAPAPPSTNGRDSAAITFCATSAASWPLRMSGDQDRELVAAEAADDVRGAHAPAHPLGRLDQHVVAARMADAVVDVLEVVEVDEQHRQFGVVALGAGNRRGPAGRGSRGGWAAASACRSAPGSTAARPSRPPRTPRRCGRPDPGCEPPRRRSTRGCAARRRRSCR